MSYSPQVRSNSIILWNCAMRTPFLIASWIPVWVGVTLFYHISGTVHWFRAVLTFLCVTFMHLATNLFNDYFDDVSGNDRVNTNSTPFSGGSRVIQDGLISPANIFRAAAGCLILGMVTGLYAWYLSGNSIVLFCGIAGVGIAVFYTAPPLQFGYRGYGEILAGISFGPLVVIATYTVQADVFDARALIYSIPLGTMVSMILLINEFPDYEADKQVTKKTAVVLLGKRICAGIYLILLVFIYAYIALMAALGLIHTGSLIVLPTAVIAMYISYIIVRHFRHPKKIIPACGATIMLYIFFGLMMIVALVFFK